MRALSVTVVVILALRLVVAGGDAVAQPAAATARIGYLSSNLASNRDLREAFRQGLRDLGYVEGKSVVIEYRDAQGKLERLPTLAAELVALKVDVIVAAAGTLAALAAKQATGTVPVVFFAVGNPVTSGLVSSLARPGGNITGLSALTPELVGKWLEILKEATPGVSRVALLRQSGGTGEHTGQVVLTDAANAARTLGVQLQVVEVRGPADLNRAFAEIIGARAEALTVLSTPMLTGERTRLVDFAVKHRLPSVFSSRSFVDAGGFMSYGPSVPDMCRRAAIYVDKILKGASPADLPVEQPTKFELVINLKTANAVGLTVPQSLLVRADEVIE